MHPRSIAAVIAATYGALLGAWLVTLPAARRAFLRQALLVEVRQVPDMYRGPGPCTAVGALLVFLTNIATMGMFLGSLASPALAARLPRLRVPVPRLLNIAGAFLFVANGIWGTLVLFFNPGYTPFFIRPAEPARLATHGPYAIVRHPRYAGEAALNIILALFTGSWVPLLGIAGWPALGRQARMEEAALLTSAPAAYGKYMGRTGAFLPRIAVTNTRASHGD